MSNQEARENFNQVAERYRQAGNHDQAAKVELIREYLLNKEFRRALEDHVWQINRPS